MAQHRESFAGIEGASPAVCNDSAFALPMPYVRLSTVLRVSCSRLLVSLPPSDFALLTESLRRLSVFSAFASKAARVWRQEEEP
jgi:hypothetical protein